jgi:hypothetical protein
VVGQSRIAMSYRLRKNMDIKLRRSILQSQSGQVFGNRYRVTFCPTRLARKMAVEYGDFGHNDRQN